MATTKPQAQSIEKNLEQLDQKQGKYYKNLSEENTKNYTAEFKKTKAMAIEELRQRDISVRAKSEHPALRREPLEHNIYIPRNTNKNSRLNNT